MKTALLAFSFFHLIFSTAAAQGPRVDISNGILEGVTNSSTGISMYKGVPFAQPPVGDLRWKEPQPPLNWTGVRMADHFGHNAMQKKVFGDMNFRADSMSEDCLYLNVWTPAKTGKEKLPVLVYFYGGGFVAGDGSESRYDGESMAQKGIVSVTVNYRLGIFGFMCHPELSKESPHQVSGNYGLLDQHAALEWVQKNIAAFGGDPNRVTIAGESAGSISVCLQMASPLNKGLIAGAIGESGAILPMPLMAEGEKKGLALQQKLNASSIADLRAIPADKLLDLAANQGGGGLGMVVDGYFLPKPVAEIYASGEQIHIPLLAGWNSAEVPYQALMWGDAPTPDNYAKKIRSLYPDHADEILKLYPGNTQTEVIKSATQLGSDRFLVYGTWKWAELSAKTGGHPVYSYIFSRMRPKMVAAMGNAKEGLAGGITKGDSTQKPPAQPTPYPGASHSSEIEYALGNLNGNKVYDWGPDDYKVSDLMEAYFANFIKTGNPNSNGLPEWPANRTDGVRHYMNIDVISKAEKAGDRDRYLLLDKIAGKK